MSNTKWIAVDIETTRFNEPDGGKTRVTPICDGAVLVLGSYADSGDCANVVGPEELRDRLTEWLADPTTHLIFHNAAFDINIICDAYPRLRNLFECALRQARVHDTKILEVLCRIAHGVQGPSLHHKTSLKDLAYRYCGMELEKDERRISFGEYLGRFKDVPPPMLKYAAADALATYRVFQVLWKKAHLYASQTYEYPTLPRAISRFGPLAERNHVMGAIALWWLQRFPLRVDLEEVNKAFQSSNKILARFEAALSLWTTEVTITRHRKAGDIEVKVRVPWGKRDRHGFKLSHKALRKELALWAAENEIIPDLTDTGEVTLQADFWSEHLPRATSALIADPSLADDATARLGCWMYYTRLRMMQTRYLVPLSSAERHYPSYHVGQQVPDPAGTQAAGLDPGPVHPRAWQLFRGGGLQSRRTLGAGPGLPPPLRGFGSWPGDQRRRGPTYLDR